MGQNSPLRSSLDGELPTISYNDRCPDCGEDMQVDSQLKYQ
jgi:hypothetical protein